MVAFHALLTSLACPMDSLSSMTSTAGEGGDQAFMTHVRAIVLAEKEKGSGKGND